MNAPSSAIALPSTSSLSLTERHAEALRILLSEAEGRTGSIPATLVVQCAIEASAGGDFPVMRDALAALLRRYAAFRRDDLELVSQPARNAGLGSYRVCRHKGASSYRAWITSLSPLSASCGCADFARSSLKLCKHLFAILEHLHSSKRSRDFAAARTLPHLRWDPVRPLTGEGDWMERIQWCEPVRSSGPTSLREAAARRCFSGTGTLRPLARSHSADPARRLKLVTALLDYAHSARGGRLLAEPALVALLERERSLLQPRLQRAWTSRELQRSLRSFKQRLFPYQAEGVRKFLEHRRLLLADDMGLGKTAQAIAACHALFASGRIARGLLIVPAALKPQWLREWKLFSDAPISLVDGNPQERERAYAGCSRGFLLVNYEQVVRDLPRLQALRADIVVLDEAQRIKNWATRTAIAVKQLTPPWRLVLSGTPLENRLDELVSLVEWVDDLALEPKWRLAPAHTVRADGTREIVGARNLDTLRLRLSGCMLRRVRKEVLRQLPPRRDVRIPVPLTAEQRAAHDELDQPIASLIQRSHSRPLTQPEFLRLMSFLTQQRILCNGLAQRDFEQTWPVLERAGRPTEALLRGLYSPKLLELRELVSNLVLSQERKVVVFSQWRRMLRLAQFAVSDLLALKGVRAVFFSGDESPRRRSQNLVDFHDDPRTRILLATDAGGVGLNLQRAASCCIHLDLPWNPAVLEQRVGRVYRMGQSQPVEVYHLVSESGIESRISSLVADKRALFNGLFDGGSDEIRFERSGSFLQQVQSLVAPAGARAVPDLEVESEELDAVEAPEPEVVDAAAPSTSPSPAGRVDLEALRALFSNVEVRAAADGRVTFEAPPDAAAALATVLEGVARLFASATPPRGGPT